MTTSIPPTHPSGQHADGTTCEHCLVPAPRNRSAMIAWIVAGVAVALLIVVYFLGIGSSRGTFVAASGFGLAGLLICPLAMGVMMWFMMRKH